MNSKTDKHYPVKYSAPYVRYEANRLFEEHVRDADDDTIFLVVMDGGNYFANLIFQHTNDLFERPAANLHIEYIKVNSYNGSKRGRLTWSYFPSCDLEGKKLVVIDDICDSGSTINRLHSVLQSYKPASIDFLVLIAREGYKLDEGVNLYPGILDKSDDFFVGCGMDDNWFARNLDYVGVIPKENVE